MGHRKQFIRGYLQRGISRRFGSTFVRLFEVHGSRGFA